MSEKVDHGAELLRLLIASPTEARHEAEALIAERDVAVEEARRSEMRAQQAYERMDRAINELFFDEATVRAEKAEAKVEAWKKRAAKAQSKIRRVKKLQRAWRHDHSDNCRANRHPYQWGDCDCGSFDVWHGLDAALADEPPKGGE